MKRSPSSRHGSPRAVLLAALLALALMPCFAAPSAARGVTLEAYGQPGPYAVSVEHRSLCCDRKRNAVDLYRPEATGGIALPVVTWGNGTWASPDKYDLLLRHLASWGMVVVATRDSSVADGQTMLDALALLHSRGPAFNVDWRRVAAVGHSQGAGGAVNAAITGGGAIRTIVAIDLPARKFCRAHDCDAIPAGLRAPGSILFLSGERDPLSPAADLAAYYAAVPPGLGKAMALVRGADHNDVQGQPACGFLAIGCRHGAAPLLPPITAWLVWKLGIDPRAKGIFIGSRATFTEAPTLAAAAAAP